MIGARVLRGVWLWMALPPRVRECQGEDGGANCTGRHLPIESLETQREVIMDVCRGAVFSRSQGVAGRRHEHQGSLPRVRCA